MEKFISTPIASGLFSKAGYVASADQIVFKDDNGNITQTLSEAMSLLAASVPVAAQYAAGNAVQKQYNENESLVLNWFGGTTINSKYSGQGVNCKFYMIPANLILLEYYKEGGANGRRRNIILGQNGISLNYFDGGSSHSLSINENGVSHNLVPLLSQEDYTVTINGIQYKRYDNITLSGGGDPINLSSYYTKDEVNNRFLTKLPNTTVFLTQDELTRIGTVINLQGQDIDVSADYVYVNNIRKLDLQTNNNTIEVNSNVSVNGDTFVNNTLYADDIESADYNLIKVTTVSQDGDYINVGDVEASGIKLHSAEPVKVVDDENGEYVILTEDNYNDYVNADKIRHLSNISDATFNSSLKNAITSFINRSFSQNNSFRLCEGIIKSNNGYVFNVKRYTPADSGGSVKIILEGYVDMSAGSFFISQTYKIWEVTFTPNGSQWDLTNYGSIL